MSTEEQIEYVGRLRTRTITEFGWFDRWRILWGKKFHLEVETKTQHDAGEVHSESRSWVDPILPKRPAQGIEVGYAEVEDPSDAAKSA